MQLVETKSAFDRLKRPIILKKIVSGLSILLRFEVHYKITLGCITDRSDDMKTSRNGLKRAVLLVLMYFLLKQEVGAGIINRSSLFLNSQQSFCLC